jgi:hemolysin D
MEIWCDGQLFPMRVAIKQNSILMKDRWVPVTAEVKTGKRWVVEFFLLPMMRYQDEARRER